MLKPFFLFFPFLIFLSSCKKENPEQEPELPFISYSGKNKMGAVINDRVWVTKGGGISFYIQQEEFHAEYYQGKFRLVGYHYWEEGEKSGIESLEIYFHYITGPGKYELGSRGPFSRDYNHPFGEFYGDGERKFGSGVDGLFQTDSNFTGEASIIKFDTFHNIVAGTFWFNAVNPDTGDSINVTNGRFDVKFDWPDKRY